MGHHVTVGGGCITDFNGNVSTVGNVIIASYGFYKRNKQTNKQAQSEWGSWDPAWFSKQSVNFPFVKFRKDRIIQIRDGKRADLVWPGPRLFSSPARHCYNFSIC